MNGVKHDEVDQKGMNAVWTLKVGCSRDYSSFQMINSQSGVKLSLPTLFQASLGKLT
jgi:hypothetical protein